MFDFIRQHLDARGTAKKYRHLMKNGVWRMSNRQFKLDGAKPIAFETLAEKYISTSKSNVSAKQSIKAAILRILGLDRVAIRGRAKTFAASYLYVSRSGDCKLFDTDNNAVLTTTDLDRWAAYLEIEALDIFKYFRKSDASLIEDQTGLMRHENLLSAPPVGCLNHAEQIRAFGKIWETYATYVRDCKTAPSADVIMSSYQEVLELLPDAPRQSLARYHDRVSELANRYCLVPAHLDFNIANVLVDDDIWLIDLEDAGLQLPAMYDVINFAFNEVYEGRSPWMINAMLSPEFSAQLDDMILASIIEGRRGDFETALLVNFVLRESFIVSSTLLKGTHTDEQIRRRVLKNWNLFEQIIPNWELGGVNINMESNGS